MEDALNEASDTWSANGHGNITPTKNKDGTWKNNNDEPTHLITTINELDSKLIEDSAVPGDENETEKKYESWYNVEIFLLFLASFQLVNLLTLTYTDSVLNFIAKRFRIPSTMASFIPSSYQVGNMVAIIPVSYFGAKWHRPRAICVGVMLMLLGLGFCILPHFILPTDNSKARDSLGWMCKRTSPSPFLIKRYIGELAEHNITVPSFNLTRIESILERSINKSHHLQPDAETEKKTSWFTTIVRNLASYYHNTDNLIKPSLTTPTDLPCNANATMYNPSILLIIGHGFIGAGSSPLWPLGIAYLDDHLVSRKLPIYLGIFIGTTLTGPVAGFLLGSLSSAIYVSIDAHNLKPTDPAWIGAWWLGYVIAGTMLVILLIPFYFFPERLKVTEEKIKEREEYEIVLAEEISAAAAMDSETVVNDTLSATLREIQDLGGNEHIPLLYEEETNKQRIWDSLCDLFCSIRRLLSIPLVLGCFLAYIILANLLSGVATFGSTFIERQFNVLRITSDMLIGGVCVPLAIIGTFGGGFIMKKFDFSTSQSLLFNVLVAFIGSVFLMSLFGLGCETPEIAGISKPYLSEKIITAKSECNTDCGCTEGEINLLCSQENVTYISPCLAGCTAHTPASKDGNIKESYSQCSCVVEPSQQLIVGPCSTKDCSHALAGAIICASIGIMILCLCQAPTYTILLRSLRVEDKPLAIGLLTFLSRLLGFIPAPIWFALVIDKTCIYWGPRCKGKSVCKLYNNRGLRLNYVGACMSCAATYALIFALTAAWFLYIERKETEHQKKEDHLMKDIGKTNTRDPNWERRSRIRSFTRTDIGITNTRDRSWERRSRMRSFTR